MVQKTTSSLPKVFQQDLLMRQVYFFLAKLAQQPVKFLTSDFNQFYLSLQIRWFLDRMQKNAKGMLLQLRI